MPEKGETNNPNGRPKKLVNQFKDFGYKQSEYSDMVTAMLGLTVEQLKEIDTDKSGKFNVAEQTIAKSLIKGREAGKMEALEILNNRVYGQPTKKIEQVIPEQILFPDIKRDDVSTDNGDK